MKWLLILSFVTLSGEAGEGTILTLESEKECEVYARILADVYTPRFDSFSLRCENKGI